MKAEEVLQVLDRSVMLFALCEITLIVVMTSPLLLMLWFIQPLHVGIYIRGMNMLYIGLYTLSVFWLFPVLL